MNAEVFEGLMSKLAAKYDTTIGARTKARMRNVTYDIPDALADKLYERTVKRCAKLPDVKMWSAICFDFRDSTRLVENETHCLACNDEGVIFWTEKHNPKSAICPFCGKGASMKRRSPRDAFCDPIIATAAKKKNAYVGEKDEKQRRHRMVEYLIYQATELKEREIEL